MSGSFLVITGANAARADEDGHAKYHTEFYQYLKQPGNGASCCDNHDCRPAKYRMTKEGPEFFIGGRWIVPPKRSVMRMLTPDGQGHWCGIDLNAGNPLTYCAIIPLGSV
jgi:hypothetical protein